MIGSADPNTMNVCFLIKQTFYSTVCSIEMLSTI